MTKKQAIKESIEHWERMIKWAKKQPKRRRTSTFKMYKNLGENWFGKSCALCRKYSLNALNCGRCPLEAKYDKCGVWRDVTWSKTWGEWLKHAKVMLKQLRSL